MFHVFSFSVFLFFLSYSVCINNPYTREIKTGGNKMREIKLNDNWEVSGIDFDEFVEVIKELTKMTKCRKV